MAEEGSPALALTAFVAPNVAELQAVDERLLLAGLREQEQAAEARHLAAVLEHRALHDPLTAVPNRALFSDRLEQAVLAAGREGAAFALLFLDLDHFEAVNDRLGHHAGDLLLRQIAARLRGALREADTLARRYGDEFAALLAGADATAAARVARAPRRAGPALHDCGRDQRAAASIGIAVYLAHGPDANALLRAADAAMYSAKRVRSGYAVAGFIEEQQYPQPQGGCRGRWGGSTQRPTGWRG